MLATFCASLRLHCQAWACSPRPWELHLSSADKAASQLLSLLCKSIVWGGPIPRSLRRVPGSGQTCSLLLAHFTYFQVSDGIDLASYYKAHHAPAAAGTRLHL